MNLIKMPFKVGIPIVNYLKTIGIEPRKDNGGGLTFQFTQEELDMVLDIKIDDPTPGCLQGLEYCHNLKSLDIKNESYSAFNNSNMSISDADIKIISRLVSLESLALVGQKRITWVDVTDLVNLERLTIERNNSLDLIEGLELSKKIKELSVFGNKELFKIQGIKELIKNNELEVLELDLLNFPEVSDLMPQLLSILTCQFYETCSSGKDIHYNCGTASLFHKRCLEIEKKILLQNPSNIIDTIILLEKYIAENVSYDYDALEKKGKYHEIDGVKRGYDNGTQSAYNGLIYGSCVCEGYTRSMQYLLKLFGIKSKNVYCISGKDKIKINENYGNRVELPDDGYHSIVRIENDNYIYYCDPCWDSCRWHKGDSSLPYCLKNRNDISKNHTLSFEENGVGGIYPSINQEYIKSVLDMSKDLANDKSNLKK